MQQIINKKNNNITIFSMPLITIISMIFSPLVFLFFPAIDLIFSQITKFLLDNNGELIVLYIFSALIFSIFTYLNEDNRKILFIFFIAYLIMTFTISNSMMSSEIIRIINLEKMSGIDKLLTISTGSFIIFAKATWVFFFIAINSENIKDHFINSTIVIISLFIATKLGGFYLFLLLSLIWIIKYFFGKKIEKNENLNLLITLYMFFSFYIILAEFLILFNITALSINMLTLAGYSIDAEIYKSIIEKFGSFQFINFVLKNNLLGFNENLYRGNGYSELLSNNSLLYIINIIRDKLSFVFILLICLYNKKSDYTTRFFEFFLITSIIIFLLNFMFFLEYEKSNNDVFIKLIYNIFIYFIIYLIFSFNVMNKSFLKNNIKNIIFAFILYISHYYLSSTYGLNILGYITFYFLFKIKDQIVTVKNNTLFLINLLLSFIIIGLITELKTNKNIDCPNLYEIASFFICSITILFFTKTIDFHKQSITNIISNINYIFIAILLKHLLAENRNIIKKIDKYENYKNFIRRSKPKKNKG